MAQILRGFALSLNQKLIPVSQLTQTSSPPKTMFSFPSPQPKDQTTVQFHHTIGFYKDGSKWSDLHQWSCTDSVSYRITKLFNTKWRFFLKSWVDIRYQDISSDDFIFISTVLKVHLYAGLFTSWEKRDCKLKGRLLLFLFLKKRLRQILRRINV